MKRRLWIIGLILLNFSMPGFAEVYSANPDEITPPTGGDMTAQYLKNLGNYIGYDLTQNISTLSDTLLSFTLNVATASTTEQNTLYALFRSIPINAAFNLFFTGTVYDSFNSAANALYQGYASSNTSANNSISITPQFDQQQWQQDPVTQAVLNIVGTPDLDVCPGSTDGPSSTSTSSGSTTPCLSSFAAMSTVLSNVTTQNGQLPGEYDYMNYESNTSQFINQLNGDNLISPIVYSTSGGTQQQGGLPAGNQLQLAQAFIRYATEGVLPIPVMTVSDYSALRNLAYPPITAGGNVASNIDISNMNQAKIALASYLLSLRVYAAKSSVAISNLYYILSRRMPQSTAGGVGGGNTSTSQAMNEFAMATWRLFNPQTQEANDQWAQQINTAAPSTVQKEMAILLSEINYQLYLSRQQQERLLLTNSLILMQLVSQNKPKTEFPTNVNRDSSIPETSSSS